MSYSPFPVDLSLKMVKFPINGSCLDKFTIIMTTILLQDESIKCQFWIEIRSPAIYVFVQWSSNVLHPVFFSNSFNGQISKFNDVGNIFYQLRIIHFFKGVFISGTVDHIGNVVVFFLDLFDNINVTIIKGLIGTALCRLLFMFPGSDNGLYRAI